MISKVRKRDWCVMKWIIKLIILEIVIGCIVLGVKIKQYNNKEYQEYCYQIYKEIQDEDFKYAKFDKKTLIFMDENRSVLYKKDYSNYNTKWKILYIENRKDTIVFWKKGAVDDRIGLMFIRERKLSNMLDGINTLKRRGGNIYEVST